MMTYSIVRRLLLGTIDNHTRHTRDHDDRTLDALLDHMMTSLFGKQKSAIDIDVQHILPVIELIVFGSNSTSNSSIRTEDIDFAKVLHDLAEGFLDDGFVCCVAFIGAKVRWWKTPFFYFGVDGFDGLLSAVQGEINDCTMATR